MSHSELKAKAERLLALHVPSRMLVLPNVWDPLGARILEREGFRAVATASAAVSASLGYADGERLARSTMLGAIERIASSVDVPVTADMEAGYADSTDELAETMSLLLDAGAVGVNIEDSILEGAERRSVDAQCARIAAAREAAARRDVHLVINARIDGFLLLERTQAIDDAVTRARAYSAAGADCVYPVGPGDEKTIRALRSGIHGPINILVSPTASSLDTLRGIGVERVSFGPYVFRSLAHRFVDIVRAIRDGGGPGAIGPTLSRDETGRYLRDEKE